MQIKQPLKASRESVTNATRRAQIIKAAIDTIAELGYDSASFARITERAGLSSPRLISYHFAGKQDLIEAIAESVYRAGAQFMIGRMEQQDSAAGRLQAYVEANLAFLREHPKEIRALTELGAHLRDASGEAYSSAGHQEPGVRELEELLRVGQRSGEFRDFDPRSMAVMIRSAIEAAAPRLNGPHALDLAVYSREVVTTFLTATTGQATR
jgi:AcrR family transcriptional regulator